MNRRLALTRGASGVNLLEVLSCCCCVQGRCSSEVLVTHTIVLAAAGQLFGGMLCRAAAVMSSAEALGIDVEWRPTGSQGGSQKASILQVPHALPQSVMEARQASCMPSLLLLCACCKHYVVCMWLCSGP